MENYYILFCNYKRSISPQVSQEHWGPKGSPEGMDPTEPRERGESGGLREKGGPRGFLVSLELQVSKEPLGPYTAGKCVPGNMILYSNMDC